jgi:DUF971 family protein
MIKPLKIKLDDGKGLFIKWEDNAEGSIPLERLRRLCPCASCVIERERNSKSYIPVFNKDQVTVSSLKPVGSYAVAVSWKDGHSTGIYEYAYLKMLSLEKSAG